MKQPDKRKKSAAPEDEALKREDALPDSALDGVAGGGTSRPSGGYFPGGPGGTDVPGGPGDKGIPVGPGAIKPECMYKKTIGQQLR